MRISGGKLETSVKLTRQLRLAGTVEVRSYIDQKSPNECNISLAQANQNDGRLIREVESHEFIDERKKKIRITDLRQRLQLLEI